MLILAWGTTFAAVKIGLESAPPVLFAGLRALIGGALIAVIAWHRTGMPRLAGQGRAYSLITALNVVLFFGLQTAAIGLLPSGLDVRKAAYRRSTQILLRGHVPLYRASTALRDALLPLCN